MKGFSQAIDKVGQGLFALVAEHELTLRIVLIMIVNIFNCFDALIKGQYKSGVYLLRPNYLKPFKV